MNRVLKIELMMTFFMSIFLSFSCTSMQTFPEEYQWYEYYPIFSYASSYSDDSYLNLIGEPDIEECGSGKGVWTPQYPDQGEVWLILQFSYPVPVRRVYIYQGMFSGAISSIEIKDEDQNGNFQRFIIEDDSLEDCAIYELELNEGEEVTSQEIRLNIDTDLYEGEYEEIDTATIWAYLPKE